MNDDILQLNGAFGSESERNDPPRIGLATNPQQGLVYFKFTRGDEKTAYPMSEFAIDGPSAARLAINLLMRLDPKTVAKVALLLMNEAYNATFRHRPRVVVPANWDPTRN